MPSLEKKCAVAIGPLRLDRCVAALGHRILVGSGRRGCLGALQRRDGVAQIRHPALEIGAPGEQVVDFGRCGLLRLGETIDRGLDLGLEAGEEGRDAGIHGFTSLAETARLDEMRQDGAERGGGWGL